MTARLGADDLVVRAISVEPRALPFPECTLAAPNAQLLVGLSANDIEASVRSALGGTMGCTHLNDTLRFLRFAAATWPPPRRTAARANRERYLQMITTRVGSFTPETRLLINGELVDAVSGR